MTLHGRRPRWFALLALLFVLLALLGCTYYAYAKYARLRTSLALAEAHLEQAQSMVQKDFVVLLGADGLTALKGKLVAAEAELRSAREEAGLMLPILARLGWVPQVGPTLASAEPLLDLALALCRGSIYLLQGLEPLSPLIQQRTVSLLGRQSLTDQVLAALEQGQPYFERAQSELRQATVARQRLAGSSPGHQVGAYLERLDAIMPQLETAAKLAAPASLAAKVALGFHSRQRYLVLAQNSAELRPTGGFIAALWVLEIEEGRISRLDFFDSGAVDDPTKEYPPPPQALFDYMHAGQWLLRDGNWSPDFPTSARVVAQLYKLGHNEDIDGVIALDEAALQLVVAALGPLYLPEFGETVTEETVLSKIMAQFGGDQRPPDGPDEALPRHKRYIAAIFKAMMGQLEKGLSLAQMLRLGNALNRSLAERHLLVYLDHPSAQALLQEARWDGTILPHDGDYLQVVDANVGYSKVNPQIAQSINYQVSLSSDGEVQGKVTVSYHNRSTSQAAQCYQSLERLSDYQARMEGCYWDYLRIFVPQGAQLVRATYEPLPSGSLLRWAARRGELGNDPTVGPPEKGRESFGNFFVVPPGGRKEITFEYRLPKAAEGEHTLRYSLLVQKQSGTAAIPLRVRVVLPPGIQVLAVRPQPAKIGAQEVEFEADLSVDRLFEVELRM